MLYFLVDLLMVYLYFFEGRCQLFVIFYQVYYEEEDGQLQIEDLVQGVVDFLGGQGNFCVLCCFKQGYVDDYRGILE